MGLTLYMSYSKLIMDSLNSGTSSETVGNNLYHSEYISSSIFVRGQTLQSRGASVKLLEGAGGGMRCRSEGVLCFAVGRWFRSPGAPRPTRQTWWRASMTDWLRSICHSVGIALEYYTMIIQHSISENITFL